MSTPLPARRRSTPSPLGNVEVNHPNLDDTLAEHALQAEYDYLDRQRLMYDRRQRTGGLFDQSLSLQSEPRQECASASSSQHNIPKLCYYGLYTIYT
jgi:hypothetical protein